MVIDPLRVFYYYFLFFYYFFFRLVWVCILLLAAGTFGFLIYNKAVYLMGNPKNVNLEVTYAPSLTFPAVTICNENKYK